MSDHQQGMKAARRFAQWHLGDPVWANLIIEAYQNPEGTIRNLDKEVGALEADWYPADGGDDDA